MIGAKTLQSQMSMTLTSYPIQAVCPVRGASILEELAPGQQILKNF